MTVKDIYFAFSNMDRDTFIRLYTSEANLLWMGKYYDMPEGFRTGYQVLVFSLSCSGSMSIQFRRDDNHLKEKLEQFSMKGGDPSCT